MPQAAFRLGIVTMLLPIRRLLHCLLVLAFSCCCSWGSAVAQPALVLDAARPQVDLWPMLRVLPDAGRQLDLAAVQQRLDDFRPHTGPHANLGTQREAVWLYLPLQVAGGDGRWVLDIQYPVLNQADVYLLRGGQLLQQARAGRQASLCQPAPARAHPCAGDGSAPRAAAGAAAAGRNRHRHGAADHPQHAGQATGTGRHQPAAARPAARGGAGLAGLQPGALAQPAPGRVRCVRADAAGNDLFLLPTTPAWRSSTCGPSWAGLLAKLSPLAVLVALAAGSRFVALSLDTRRHSPRIHQGLVARGVASAAMFCLSLLGGLGYRGTQLAAVVLGPWLPLLAIPAAWGRARVGDSAARYMLVGWGAYTVGAVTMAGLLRGWVPANGLSLNLFQWSSLVEMLAWLRVLGLHIEAVRRHAERTELERAALVSMAHTDALTGLPNRRGLQQALATALPGCSSQQALAVFLLDLDGFKPINDRLGHDAGDTLLVQVGQRLRAQVRQGDLVARLGGDEFVIMAPGIRGEAEAMVLGRKLLDAFDLPFVVAGQACQVGLTIGFALAPHDGIHADDLLKRADAAMYAGKQAGRHTVRRGAASAGLTFSS